MKKENTESHQKVTAGSSRSSHGVDDNSSVKFSRPSTSHGLEASIAEETLLRLKTTKIVVESQDDNIIQVRVDVSGDETQKVFDQVLTNLARTAPPVPGFRRQKGGNAICPPMLLLFN
ncbi:hypothetical protein ACLB2K_035384 [Fragaria x ananassa]